MRSRKIAFVRRGAGSAVALFATALLVAACSSSGSHSGQQSRPGASGRPASGVTADTITVGVVVSRTGANAVNYFGSFQGIQARVDLQNAEGGINGRKIKLQIVDDQSNPVTAITAVDSLISKGVFSMIYNSDALSSPKVFDGPHDAGIPVVGNPLATNLWEKQPYTNFISDSGNNSSTPTAPTYVLKEFQTLGAKKIAFLSTSGCATCVSLTKATEKAAPSFGMKAVYFNATLPRGTVQVGPTVLAIANSGADSVYSLELDNTDFAIQETAKNNGYKPKVYYCSLDYTQTLIDTPAASDAAQGCIASVNQEPISAHTKATEKETGAFAKYAKFTGIPGLNWTAAWVSADLTIKGLLAVGKNPTRAAFLDALHNMKGYDADGLLPQALDMTVANFGKAPKTSCTFFVQYKGKDFEPMNDGKPVCGDVLQGS